MRIPRHLRSFFIPANVPQTEILNFFLFQLQHVCIINYLQNPHRVDFFYKDSYLVWFISLQSRDYLLRTSSYQRLMQPWPTKCITVNPLLSRFQLAGDRWTLWLSWMVPTAFIHGSQWTCFSRNWYRHSTSGPKAHRYKQPGWPELPGWSIKWNAARSCFGLITTFGPRPRSASYSMESIPSSCSRWTSTRRKRKWLTQRPKSPKYMAPLPTPSRPSSLPG